MTGAELDREVRGELGTLSKDNAAGVAQHLVMVARLLDEDPEAAYAHAMAAQRRAGRVAVVREAAGLAAYRLGRYDEALRELRTARRLTGSQEHLAVMADCERGLGRPERALAALASPEAAALDRAGLLELTMVAAGARLDLGQAAAAVVLLEVPELTAPVRDATAETQARLMSAYSDALTAAGRDTEAQEWLERAAAADVDGVTGAAERLGVEDEEILDLLEDDEDPDDEDSDDEDPDDEGDPAEASSDDDLAVDDSVDVDTVLDGSVVDGSVDVDTVLDGSVDDGTTHPADDDGISDDDTEGPADGGTTDDERA